MQSFEMICHWVQTVVCLVAYILVTQFGKEILSNRITHPLVVSFGGWRSCIHPNRHVLAYEMFVNTCMLIIVIGMAGQGEPYVVWIMVVCILFGLHTEIPTHTWINGVPNYDTYCFINFENKHCNNDSFRKHYLFCDADGQTTTKTYICDDYCVCMMFCNNKRLSN